MTDLRLGRWQDVLGDVTADAMIVDAPYSERTHAGHDDGTSDVNRCSPEDARRMRVAKRTGAVYAVGEHRRRSIDYTAFSDADVADFVGSWAPRVSGWIVAITDYHLAPVWSRWLEAHGRYVFTPLPLVETGSRVRLSGDGPSSWTCWIVVARPKTREFQRWGTLPGAYVDTAERKDVVGGKPLRLMRAIVRDYSRPGDLIVDPCAGAGTTLLAARLEGRRGVGAEMVPEHHDLARRRLADLPMGTETQPALFGGPE